MSSVIVHLSADVLSTQVHGSFAEAAILGVAQVHNTNFPLLWLLHREQTHTKSMGIRLAGLTESCCPLVQTVAHMAGCLSMTTVMLVIVQ